jgi:PTH1 family peptidyl-tRNA hydrolase
VSGIRLIVGLGNPGLKYWGTPHNVGGAWVSKLAERFQVKLVGKSKFKGYVGSGNVVGRTVRMLVPSTYMNVSGESVGALARFYKIEPDEILVVHDEVDFPAGITKLKIGGRRDTHNGIRSVVAGIGNRSDFVRLRIGVGHPGRQGMIGFLTGKKLSRRDHAAVQASTDMDDQLISLILTGDMQKAMNRLHVVRTDS